MKYFQSRAGLYLLFASSLLSRQLPLCLLQSRLRPSNGGGAAPASFRRRLPVCCSGCRLRSGLRSRGLPLRRRVSGHRIKLRFCIRRCRIKLRFCIRRCRCRICCVGRQLSADEISILPRR